MTEELAALIRTPPPRSREAVAPLIADAVRAYRRFAWLMWGVALAVALMVGPTSKEGEKLETFFYALALGAILFAIPTHIWSALNIRKVRRLLENGHPVQARVEALRQRGNTGRKIPEIEVVFVDPSGVTRRAIANGITPQLAPGSPIDALHAPAEPRQLALYAPGLGLALATVQ